MAQTPSDLGQTKWIFSCVRVDFGIKGPGQRNSKGLFGETEGGLKKKKKGKEKEREKFGNYFVHLCWFVSSWDEEMHRTKSGNTEAETQLQPKALVSLLHLLKRENCYSLFMLLI